MCLKLISVFQIASKIKPSEISGSSTLGLKRSLEDNLSGNSHFQSQLGNILL